MIYWELIGYVGLILLNLRTIPQIIKTLKTKNVNGILFYWFVGGYL